MSNLHYITNDIAVYKSTIRPTSVSTRDSDRGGIPIANGSDRGVCHGISSKGIHLLWVTTNGDDQVIPDDIDDAIRVCYDLADSPADFLSMVWQGATRLQAAVDEVAGWYVGNDAAQEELAWFADKAREVLAIWDAEYTCAANGCGNSDCAHSRIADALGEVRT